MPLHGAAIARVIDAIGTDDFAKAVTHLIATAADSDSTITMLNNAVAPPQILCDQQSAQEIAVFYREYMSNVYLLSPFYNAAIKATAPQLVHLSDIAPDGFRQSEYYDVYFRQIGIRDVAAFLVPVKGGVVWHMSVGRSKDRRSFTRKDMNFLQEYLPILASAITRHSATGQVLEAKPVSAGLQPGEVMDLLQQSGGRALTRRESEVIMAMLSGHSSKSMARLLGISPETVRVHRKHVYEKLSVSGQSELFSLFLSKLGILAQD